MIRRANAPNAVMEAEPAATGPAIGKPHWGTKSSTRFCGGRPRAWSRLPYCCGPPFAESAVADALTISGGPQSRWSCARSGAFPELCQHHSAAGLLGVGVAFKIYYVMAWWSGQSDSCNRPRPGRTVQRSDDATASAACPFPAIRHCKHGQAAGCSLACMLASAALFQPRSWENHALPYENAQAHADL